MIHHKNKDGQSIAETVQQAKTFEVSMLDALRKSERRAWWVAALALLMSLLLALGYLLVMPLKRDVPYLVTLDANTGVSSLSLLSDGGKLNTNEAVSKSNVAHFVTARESYDWDLINRRDWHTVFSMASPQVAKEYEALFSEGNPNSPDKIWGQKTSLRIKIKSIVLMGGDVTTHTAPTGATVRFDRMSVNKDTAQVSMMDSQIATLAFEYKPNLKMTNELRVENPLGFQVIAYRVDNEQAGAAPSVLDAASPIGAGEAAKIITPKASEAASVQTTPTPATLDLNLTGTDGGARP